MVDKNLQDTFLALVRQGIGIPVRIPSEVVDWLAIQSLAMEQGLYAIVLDGIEKMTASSRPPQEFLLEWIGIVMQDEARFSEQQKTARKMAGLFNKNHIRTYVLKGDVVAECYPNPEHRVCSDMDCFLLSERNDFDAWSLGNNLIKNNGYDVSDDFYKHSTFYLHGLKVENHRFMTPLRGNRKLKNLERYLQSQLKVENEKLSVERFEGTFLYKPPVMVTALFLIEHSYSHFLHEGLTWRHVLDWMMFSRKHKNEIDWRLLDTLIDEFGFRKFYDSYYCLGRFLLGEILEDELSMRDKKMLADVWAPLDLHETLHGIKGKLYLVGNTLRAWWKYHFFSEISMFHALWIQVYGFLFIKKSSLD